MGGEPRQETTGAFGGNGKARGKAREWWENRVGKNAWLQCSVGMVRHGNGGGTASGNKCGLQRLVGMVRHENGGRTARWVRLCTPIVLECNLERMMICILVNIEPRERI